MRRTLRIAVTAPRPVVFGTVQIEEYYNRLQQTRFCFFFSFLFFNGQFSLHGGMISDIEAAGTRSAYEIRRHRAHTNLPAYRFSLFRKTRLDLFYFFAIPHLYSFLASSLFSFFLFIGVLFLFRSTAPCLVFPNPQRLHIYSLATSE